MEEGWEGVSKSVTCLQIYFFLTKDLLFTFADGDHKIGHFLTTSQMFDPK